MKKTLQAYSQIETIIANGPISRGLAFRLLLRRMTLLVIFPIPCVNYAGVKSARNPRNYLHS